MKRMVSTIAVSTVLATAALAATINGTTGNDNLSGTTGDDLFYAKAGNDIIFAKSGNDEIYGAAGADTVYGAAGDDVIFGGNDSDLIFGGDGDDLIYGGSSADTIYVGEGNDVVITGMDGDVVHGNSASRKNLFVPGHPAPVTGNDTATYYQASNGEDIYVGVRSGDGAGLARIVSKNGFLGTPRFPLVLPDGVTVVSATDGSSANPECSHIIPPKFSFHISLSTGKTIVWDCMLTNNPNGTSPPNWGIGDIQIITDDEADWPHWD